VTTLISPSTKNSSSPLSLPSTLSRSTTLAGLAKDALKENAQELTGLRPEAFAALWYLKGKGLEEANAQLVQEAAESVDSLDRCTLRLSVEELRPSGTGPSRSGIDTVTFEDCPEARWGEHDDAHGGELAMDQPIAEGHQFTDRTAELALFGIVERHLPSPSACATSSCAGSSAC
jgi:hypothetical protein